jgi:hypothetical protein
LILAVIGAVLLAARARGEINLSIVTLAAGAAAGLAIIEFVYVLKKVISTIYLLDAVIEIIIIGAWIAAVALR